MTTTATKNQQASEDEFAAVPPPAPPQDVIPVVEAPPESKEPEQSTKANEEQDLPPDVIRVKEILPDLPVPAIHAALQKASVQAVIDAALNGTLDTNAVPIPEPTE